MFIIKTSTIIIKMKKTKEDGDSGGVSFSKRIKVFYINKKIEYFIFPQDTLEEICVRVTLKGITIFFSYTEFSKWRMR